MWKHLLFNIHSKKKVITFIYVSLKKKNYLYI